MVSYGSVALPGWSHVRGMWPGGSLESLWALTIDSPPIPDLIQGRGPAPLSSKPSMVYSQVSSGIFVSSSGDATCMLLHLFWVETFATWNCFINKTFAYINFQDNQLLKNWGKKNHGCITGSCAPGFLPTVLVAYSIHMLFKFSAARWNNPTKPIPR